MQPLPGHTLRPSHHRLHVGEQGTIPMLFETAPTALNRIVLAVVRRIVQQLHWNADVLHPLHHPIEELRAHPATFRAVVHFDLQPRYGLLLLGRQLCPPGLEGIDDEVAGFVGTPKPDKQFTCVFIDDTARNVLLLAAHVVVAGSSVSSGFAPARGRPQTDTRLAVKANALRPFSLALRVLLRQILENQVGFGQLFWGLALSTLRNR